MSQPVASAESPTIRPYYAQDVDFDELAKQDPAWDVIVQKAKKSKWLDFQDPKVVLQLTQTIAQHHFGLPVLSLPPDRLCPPIPIRWNYLHWIHDLLATSSPTYTPVDPTAQSLRGLDIGTGASAIHPLLLCATHSHLTMLATDIDATSLTSARANIATATFTPRITCALTTTDAPLLQPLTTWLLPNSILDFVTLNPPFYASEADMLASQRGKKAAPSAFCAGAPAEMICPGGDVGFVKRLIDESLLPEWRGRVRWFTAFLGRKESLTELVGVLRERGVGNWGVVTLQAGRKTRRWGLAWSTGGLRAGEEVGRGAAWGVEGAVLPDRGVRVVEVPLVGWERAGARVRRVVEGLDVGWSWDGGVGVGVVEAGGDVWSRKARRKRAREVEAGVGKVAKGKEVAKLEEIALAVKIICKDEEVEMRWLRGTDNMLFVSFCGVLERALHERK